MLYLNVLPHPVGLGRVFGINVDVAVFLLANLKKKKGHHYLSIIKYTDIKNIVNINLLTDLRHDIYELKTSSLAIIIRLRTKQCPSLQI